MYMDAADVVSQGQGGKWIKVTPDEEMRIVRSIAGENLIRGTKGQPALRHYSREGYLVICEGPGHDAETHPLDLSKK